MVSIAIIKCTQSFRVQPAMPVLAEPVTAQLDALLHHAAFAPLDDQGWLRVTGSDRVRWLNGMVTNSITGLQNGEGNYNFVLNAQGRIQGDLTAFAVPDALVLKTDRTQILALLPLLDRFIIMDDVELAELADATGTWSGLILIGAKAPTLLAQLGLTPPGPNTLTAILWQTHPLTLIHAHSPLVPRFELWASHETLAILTQTLTASGATPADPAALEALRILEGTPRYGLDIRDRDLPQETNQTRALHFSKGCYLGQEIVERIRSRGQVHRTFTGFHLQGELPPPGTPLQAGGKPIGELTSTATLPSGPTHLALGYIRREALERNATLTYTGGQAIATSLPFASEIYERP